MIPTLPLRLRNRLAETILAALHDAAARRELAALAAEAGGAQLVAGRRAPLDRSTGDPSAGGLRGAGRSSAARRRGRPGPDAGRAAALFDAGLYFEVHEVLEPHWMAADGPEREALQGLIQIAVG